MIERFVWIKTSFIGFHRFKESSDDFLRNYHRHVFHVNLMIAENHDRDIEFIALKTRVDTFLAYEYANKRFDKSCEEIAEHLMEAFDARQVSVSEDDENGALLIQKG